MDFHNDGKVNYSEFLAATISSLNFFQEEKLWTVFKFFDRSNKGFITFESVLEALKTNNITVNEQGLKEFFDKNRTAKEGMNYEVFKRMIEQEKLIK